MLLIRMDEFRIDCQQGVHVAGQNAAPGKKKEKGQCHVVFSAEGHWITGGWPMTGGRKCTTTTYTFEVWMMENLSSDLALKSAQVHTQ